jgi:ATP-binding cassette subfamily B protein
MYHAIIRVVRLQAGSKSLTFLLATVGIVIVLAYAVHNTLSPEAGRGGLLGDLKVDDLVNLLMYGALVANPVGRLGRTNHEIQHSLALARRIFEVLDIPDEQRTGSTTLPRQTEPALEFDHVSFAYRPDLPVLHDVSFAVTPGESVAIVGPSGGGKSTLSYLALRFFDPAAGRILFGSDPAHDLRELRIEQVRDRIGWVGQEPFLFHGTIAENIAYGMPDASRESIEHAAHLACADDFIRALPDAFDTMVGERGVTLSGGQCARLAIARVVLRNPSVAIFDEATAALDAQTELRLWRRLEAWRSQRTVLMITHRLQTVLECPRVLVIEHGRIAGDGAAEQLLLACRSFQKIFGDQLGARLQPQEDLACG